MPEQLVTYQTETHACYDGPLRLQYLLPAQDCNSRDMLPSSGYAALHSCWAWQVLSWADLTQKELMKRWDRTEWNLQGGTVGSTGPGCKQASHHFAFLTTVLEYCIFRQGSGDFGISMTFGSSPHICFSGLEEAVPAQFLPYCAFVKDTTALPEKKLAVFFLTSFTPCSLFLWQSCEWNRHIHLPQTCLRSNTILTHTHLLRTRHSF